MQLCGRVEREHEPVGHMALSTTGAPSSSTEHAEAAHSVWSDGKAPAVPQLTGRVPTADGGGGMQLEHMHVEAKCQQFCAREPQLGALPSGKNVPAAAWLSCS